MMGRRLDRTLVIKNGCMEDGRGVRGGEPKEVLALNVDGEERV